MIFKKIKKVMLLMIFSVIFSTTTLSQTGSALTLTPSNDFYAIFGTSTYNNNNLQINTENNDNINKVSFLQFDISSLKGQTIDNTTALNLYTQEGIGTASLYYIADTQNSWVSSYPPSGEFDQTQLDTLIGSSPTALVSGVPAARNGEWESFSSPALANYLQKSINIQGNNYFSLALMEDPTGQAQFDSTFDSKGINPPSLDVAIDPPPPPVPAPEPSSIVLGLVGLSGILGFRKKTCLNNCH